MNSFADEMCAEFPNARMSDQARVIIVDIHNRRRAVLAQGLVRNGRNYYNMPKGSNIMEMAYNCTLEAGAQMYADRCTSEGSPDDQRPLWGENFLVIKETLDPILAMSRCPYPVYLMCLDKHALADMLVWFQEYAI
ncbi:hypothetical protein Y032_0002g610 [Ancylostoma ceylanicum]|nr:hypothetical protein Y032_0002g610 [Ancylostoma ceylanicum]